MTTRSMGSEGFKWFVGTVEDRDDPLKIGRLRVRIFNMHSESRIKVQTTELPWAIPINPIFSASFQQVGLAPVGAVVGSTVVGFFADGNSAQIPLVIGTLPGIPDGILAQNDVPGLAREINTINKQQMGPEPASAYGARYPFNKVFTSESGHVFEVDDTPNRERIHSYHRAGTYTEIGPEGSRVQKIVGDDYEIVVKDKKVFVSGNVIIDVNGVATINAPGGMEINGDVQLNGRLNVVGEIIGNGVEYNQHTHSDPQDGTTGIPQ